MGTGSWAGMKKAIWVGFWGGLGIAGRRYILCFISYTLYQEGCELEADEAGGWISRPFVNT